MSSISRRAFSKLINLLNRAADPTITDGRQVALYAKSDGSSSQLFARTSDGTINQITPVGGGVITAGNGTAFYGDGFDGNMTFDGTAAATGGAGLSLAAAGGIYTLTRDLYASNITITGGATTIIITNGFRIFCLNTLANDGVIQWNGGNGGNGVAGAFGAGGAAGAANSTTILFGGTAGGAGGAGDGGSGGGGSAGAAPASSQLGATAGTVVSNASGSLLQGGAGGGNGVSAGGDVNAHAAYLPNNVNTFHTITGLAIYGRNILSVQPGNGSAGAGARAGRNADGGGGGGGGGASGSTVVVMARLITGAGTIRALGGNGGNGAGRGGGGGGGSGGIIILGTDGAFPISNTVSVAGGTAGAPGGAPSQSGGNGGAGLVYQLNLNR